MALKCVESQFVAYLNSYFVTIATILGTGILGLPVTLTHSGLYPFLISFFISATVQSILVHFFTDLMQRAVAAQHQDKGEESLPLNTMLEEDIVLESDDDDDENGASNGAIMKGKMLHIREIPLVQPPNLHLLGKLFLGCGLAQAFDALIILQFISLLICYALAGSEAFGQLIGAHFYYVIPVFVWVLTLAIVFGLQFIQPVVSILTFIKGSLLLGTTTITFYVGMTVAEKISSDFSYVGAPFLMGTVALGGVINTMPCTFEKITYKKAQISKYRLAVQLGLWTCVLLNVLWCWAVLDIVPQTVEKACYSQLARAKMYSNTSGSYTSTQVCSGELSLESAAAAGEISTIPLTKILQRNHPHFSWVAILVQVFIMVSITVSYLTIGAAMHHTLNGIMQSFMVKRREASPSRGKGSTKKAGPWFMRTGISLLMFAIVFAVAILEPQGFVDILEKLVSFGINVEVGLFVFLMIFFAHRGPYRNLEIPLPTPPILNCLMFILPLFFNFAVVFDFYSTVRDILYPYQHHSFTMNATFPPSTNSTTTTGNTFTTAGSGISNITTSGTSVV